ncbi:MAG: DUF6231 family protein [Moraxellaceae bacterium]
MSHPFLPLVAETLAVTAAREAVLIGDLPWPAQSACTVTPLDLPVATEQIPSTALAIAALPANTGVTAARQLIACLRDLKARQLLVFVPETLLDDTALLGLGLTRQARYELDGEQWQAWSFDIRHYKSVPDWLNPRFWANPENWNKYRW